MKGFKLEVSIDNDGHVKSNIEESTMSPLEIIAFLEMQKNSIINNLLKKKEDDIKVEILE